MRVTNSIESKRRREAKSEKGSGARVAHLSPVEQRPGARDEVIRDIRHALGNHFHKLYYWADFVQESDAVPQEDTTTQPLTRTIQNLEGFLEIAMAYLQPARIEPVRMSAGDVARAALQVVESELATKGVHLELAAEVETRELSIDPGRFSMVLRKAVGALKAAGAGGLLGYRIRVGASAEFRAIEILVEAPIALGAAPVGELHALEWANAQRTMDSHGGSLSPCNVTDGTANVRLVLPWIG